jgi:hypothetical protein
VARRPLTAGLAAGAAIAIRPNLAPLAAVLFAWIVVAETREHGTREAMRCAIRFAAAPALAAIALAVFNARVYESPLTSGYGDTANFFSFAFFATNVRQFASWIADVETPLVVLAAVFFVAPRLITRARVPCPRLLLGGVLGVVLFSYLFYQPFDVWWYLRFLLPMWPVMMLLTAATLEAIAHRWLRPVVYPVAMLAAALFLAWHGIRTAIDRRVFDLGRAERRYVDVARFVGAHTDPGAVILSVQHSGSLRLYADRLTLRYDALDPLWLDRAVAYLQSIGRRPYYVLDGAEVAAFKSRFGAANRTGTLDWPPMATLGATIAVYDPLDRRPSVSPLAIAHTRGTRGCDAPQSWPPVLRMK